MVLLQFYIHLSVHSTFLASAHGPRQQRAEVSVIETIRRFPAEWEEQDGVLMAWPHEGTDWVPNLHAVQRVTIDIAREITRFERLLMVAPDIEEARTIHGRCRVASGPGQVL